MGSFDEAFLSIPPEVIRATIRNNQKCFVLRRDPRTATARRQIHPGRQYRGRGRRQGDRRRQRARHPRAAFRRQVLLRDRSQDAAGGSAAKSSSTSSSTRSSARNGSASRASRRLAAELAPIVGADVEKAKRAARLCQGRPAHRGGRRIPRAAGLDGEILRAGAGRGRSRRAPPARSTTSRSARMIACRPIRFRSPSRSPTRSTRWSGSGRSTRSRPEQGPLCVAAGGTGSDPDRAGK